MPAIAGWLQNERACDLFKAAGKDFAELKQQALSRNFKPIPLGIKINLATVNAVRGGVAQRGGADCRF
jgi:hypothetical protein